MLLSRIGLLAQIYWDEIPAHFPYAQLDAFVVMPNHVHGIVIISHTVEPLHARAPQGQGNDKNEQMAAISPKFGSLSSIIRSYKSAVTRGARASNEYFAWQSKFHDHIIRNDRAYYNIQRYIVNNPKKWEEDTFKS